VPNPLVAAIVPTRNRPSLVARAVRSALAQTYEPVEVVVVDDGSEEPPALEDDRRVRMLRHPSPLGAGAARNTAVAATDAPFLAFLDDDDEWLPEKLSRELELLDGAGDGVAGVESGWELWQGSRPVLRYIPRADRELQTALLARACMAPSSVVVASAAFRSVNGFDASLYRIEDWDLWVRLADRYRFLALPEVLTRRHVAEQLAPAESIRANRQMSSRLESRIARLPRGEQGPILATHDLAHARALARLGERAEARRLVWRAWRRDRSTVTSAVGRRLRSTLRRRLGREPLLVRW
jgi:glycosyltransferase involved in cell wall biosynthesis